MSDHTKQDVRLLSHDELVSFVLAAGQPTFRAKQIEDWLTKKQLRSFDEMANIPQALRMQLAEHFSLGGFKELVVQTSRDGSKKFLLELTDGVSVECVGMPSADRLTACLSSQAGCAMGCVFCATGAAGLTRSLNAAEIYDQALHIQNNFKERLSNVVLMGQGEPFANYEQTLAAMRLLNSERGLGIGARKITVSTCGVIPGIRKFSKEPEQFGLAVSLHSAVQSTRDRIMPGVRRWSLLRLHEALQDYVEATGRRPTYEYALMGGINDSGDELAALRDFCAGTLCHVNLIPLNEIAGSPVGPSRLGRAEEFVEVLEAAGVETTIRRSRGADIDAACGQLKQRLVST